MFSTETEPIVYIYQLTIDTCNYGDQEVPQSATWKLENQESQWFNSVPVWKPENKESQCLKAEDTCPSLSREQICSYCSMRVLNGLDNNLSHRWGWLSLLCLLIQMLMSSGNTLPDTSRNQILPATWASLHLVRLTHNIDHHNGLLSV